jgi:hypothetical protein
MINIIKKINDDNNLRTNEVYLFGNGKLFHTISYSLCESERMQHNLLPAELHCCVTIMHGQRLASKLSK